MKSKFDKSFKNIEEFVSQLVDLNSEANKLLSQVVQGLKQMCNHCALKDCEQCWSNDICNKIINYFENIPPIT